MEDVKFSNVVVTPMGGDRVFLHCNDGGDIWQVYNDALHFFAMLFANIHRWTTSDVKYERGAWVRVYGVLVHAWNIEFFKLCVMGAGRFLHIDECTEDKTHLDFAQILISTHQLEIVNSSPNFFFYRCKYVIKLVEEWGCSLGEDVFLTEEVYDATPEMLSQPNIVTGLEEVQGEWELDELVDDLRKEWCQHDRKKDKVQLTSVPSPNHALHKDDGTDDLMQQSQPILQPVQHSLKSASLTSTKCDHKQQHDGNLSKASTVPWSLDWLSQSPVRESGNLKSSKVNNNVDASNLQNESLPLKTSAKKKKGGKVKQFVGFIKE